MLKHSEQHRQFLTDDRQHINKARKEAEALFRSEPRLVESLPADPPPTEASVRKPRILSASPLPVTRSTAEAPISSKPQPKPPVSVSQMAHAHRELLKGARAAISAAGLYLPLMLVGWVSPSCDPSPNRSLTAAMGAVR